MQIKSLQIFSSISAASGYWIDVSNLVNLSVHLTGLEGHVWIEVSDDPNAPIDGTGIGAPSVAPTLSQFASQPGFGSLVTASPGDVSMLPSTTFFVKTTFVTKWGETTASAESSLAVLQGNYLFVAAPIPTAAQQPYVTGWNCYVGKTSGSEVLQTAPQYQPQRLIDGVGTPGGTVNPLGPNQSTHFAISGALPLLSYYAGSPAQVQVQGQNFSMVNGWQQTRWTPPSTDQSGSAASGVNISGNLPSSAASNSQIQIVVSGTSAMFNPSGLCWKFLRVVKDSTAQSLTTTAYLLGQNG